MTAVAQTGTEATIFIDDLKRLGHQFRSRRDLDHSNFTITQRQVGSGAALHRSALAPLRPCLHPENQAVPIFEDQTVFDERIDDEAKSKIPVCGSENAIEQTIT